ncbi:MAG: hypothetical protein ACXVIJ_06595, partial [Thermoanaerobaculia bacterium]
MKSRGWLLPVVALSAACAATAPAPKSAPRIPSVDAVESHRFLQDLRESRDSIVSREHVTAADTALLADIEAVASIPIPQHHSIDSAVRLFTTELRDDVQTYFNRSARYRPSIDKILAEYHLPKALGYLPVIESGYAPTMTSRAGA